MELTFLHFLIVCPLVGVAGFIDAIAGGGASLGAHAALLISEELFRILMLIILPLTALYVLRRKDLFPEEGLRPLPITRLLPVAGCIALALGLYDGFYGPGTGTFLILLLTRFARMDLRRANGITKVINLSSNVASLAVYLANAQVLLPLGLCAGLFSVLGNYLGSRCFTRKGATVARPVILTVIGVFFLRTVLELLGIL